jgi:tetrahydromethanopterin S-methyltransferase subunit H
MTKTQRETSHVLCIEDRDCDDLEKGKVYVVLSDKSAKRDGFLRIVDETGEDYLYPDSYFVPVDLPNKVKATYRTES